MGNIAPVEPVKLICGIIAGSEERFRDVKAELARIAGPVDGESERFAFDATDYYEREMGKPLHRWFVSFRALIDPARLAEIKQRTNEIEKRSASGEGSSVRRNVNLDPGYLTGASLVLATTKNFSHRIYIGDGIYAEVTLLFRKDGFTYFDWTYPDFRSGRYGEFLLQVRKSYLQQIRAGATANMIEGTRHRSSGVC